LASQGKEDRYAPVQEVLDYPKIVVTVQDPALPYGNGSPIVSAKDFLAKEEAFLVLYSDDVIFGTSDAKALVKAYEKKAEVQGIIMAQEMPEGEVNKYGVISLKEEDKNLLHNIVEKPPKGEEPSRLVSYGRYLLTPKVFEYLNASNTGLDGELWTVDAITTIAAEGKVLVEKTKGKWMTTGDPENYFLAHLHYVMNYECYGDRAREYLTKLRVR
jgi:UTP--glucose-1-phosphate uridylyltransferase